MREGIAAVIRTQSDMELVAEARDGREAVEKFRTLLPDVSLIDLQMPVMDGIASITSIRRHSPHARIVVLTTYHGDAQARAALQAGACAYLLKDTMMAELIRVIRVVHAGRRHIQPEVAMQLAEYAVADTLSQRETEVLQLVSKVSSNRLVARNLGISEETVKVHMKNIIGKLGVTDRTHAVIDAIRRGLISL
jgi:DNA-binding NarL/FixJ family response regulator